MNKRIFEELSNRFISKETGNISNEEYRGFTDALRLCGISNSEISKCESQTIIKQLEENIIEISQKELDQIDDLLTMKNPFKFDDLLEGPSQ